jgi:hypothetical protein
MLANAIERLYRHAAMLLPYTQMNAADHDDCMSIYVNSHLASSEAGS